MVIKEQNLVNSIVSWIKSIIRSHFLERDQKKKKRVKTAAGLYKSFLVLNKDDKNFWHREACGKIKRRRPGK